MTLTGILLFIVFLSAFFSASRSIRNRCAGCGRTPETCSCRDLITFTLWDDETEEEQAEAWDIPGICDCSENSENCTCSSPEDTEPGPTR